MVRLSHVRWVNYRWEKVHRIPKCNVRKISKMLKMLKIEKYPRMLKMSKCGTDGQTTREDSATQLLICETLSFANTKYCV